MDLHNKLNKMKHCVAFAIAMAVACSSFAQEEEPQVLKPGEAPKPTKYVEVTEQKQKLVFFQGFTLSVDAFGPISLLASDYGTLEGALRLNLKNTYLPIFELGYGQADISDFNTKVKYNVKAPFARIGIDFNMLKNKFQDNRLYVGARYGISTFNYEIAGPELKDPVWGGSAPFNVSGIDCTSHWGEIVAGVEVKVFKNFHMGWLVRYKREFSSTKSKFAKPSYIPGYGSTTDDSCWGGTYSLIFDLNWGLKKSKKKGVYLEIRDINTENPEAQDNDAQDAETDNTETENGKQDEGDRKSGKQE